MNESKTRAQLIDSQLIQADWGVVEGSKILRETGVSELDQSNLPILFPTIFKSQEGGIEECR